MVAVTDRLAVGQQRKPGETDRAYEKRMFKNARQRRWDAVHPEYKKAVDEKRRREYKKVEGRIHPKLTDEQKARKALAMRKWRKLNAEHLNRYNRMWRHANGLGSRAAYAAPFGSVVLTAAPSEFRDVLDYLTKNVPKWADRDELVAEAALLYVQGLEPDAAIRQAVKNVGKANREFRNMLSLDAPVYAEGVTTYGDRVRSDAVHF